MNESTETQKDIGIRFYVTESCNGCGLCKNIAPDFFDCVDYAYAYFLIRQPKDQSEVDLLRDVEEVCVVDAVKEMTEEHNERAS